MREIIIVSGVSGSGKSTLVNQLVTEAQDHSDLGGDKVWTATVSADDFFTWKDGTYYFNPSLLGEAHGQCLRRFTELLIAKVSPDNLIVDNTNTTALELAPYVALANAYKIPVRLITVATPDLEVAAKRNVHSVSIQVIKAQSYRLASRELPAFWMLREAIATPNSCGGAPFFVNNT